MKFFLLKIDGMTCASCVSKIERHIKALAGVKSVDIALLTHRGRVKYDASAVGPRDIITQISVSEMKYQYFFL